MPNSILPQDQVGQDLFNAISSFFCTFGIGNLLRKCNAQKEKGVPIIDIFKYKLYLNRTAEQNLRMLLSRRSGSPSDEDFIVTKTDGSMCSHSALTRAYERQTRYYGHRSTNIHALRHTFATRSLAAGMDIKVLSNMLGHSNVRITYDLYVHPDISEDQKTMALMEKIFSENP